MKVSFSVPCPPSTNGAYANKKGGGGRVKTKPAAEYRLLISMALLPFLRENKKHCDNNIIRRMDILRKAGKFKASGCLNVGSIHKAVKRDGNRPSYALTYTTFFPDDNPRDLANFEKLITDSLVEIGLMLDDMFVDWFLMKRGAPDPVNPRIEIIFEEI